MAMIPWFDRVAAANGVSFDPDTHLVSQVGWFSDEETDCSYSLRILIPIYRWSHLGRMPFNVQMAGARRVMCSGSIMRSVYQFFAQLPGFVAPRTEEMDTGAPGTIMMTTKNGSCAAPG